MVLEIPYDIRQQMSYYAEVGLPNEVTGIGLLEIRDPQTVRVREIFLPRQQANEYECQFAENALHEIIFDLMDRGEDTELLSFRWHSHGEGPVFWSDKDRMDINVWKGDFLASLVINTRQEALARFDVFKPFRIATPMSVLIVNEPENTEMLEQCAEEVRTRVHVTPYVGLTEEEARVMGVMDVMRKMTGKRGTGHDNGLFGSGANL